MPVFAQLPCLEDVVYDEKLSDCNDANFEIEQDSVRKGFDQPDISDLERDLGLSRKASEILASRLNEKNLLAKKDRWYHTSI